jgi:hypothetical protein
METDKLDFSFEEEGLGPVSGEVVEGVDAPFVDVDVVANGFVPGGVAALIGVYGMLGEVFDVVPEKDHHLRRQGENS